MKLKNLLAAMTLFIGLMFSACSEPKNKPADLILSNHIEFHQKHIDYVESQTEVLLKMFEHIKESIKQKQNAYVLMGEWHTLYEWIIEAKSKNRVFLSNCMHVYESDGMGYTIGSSIGRASGANSRMYYLAIRNTVRYEADVKHNKYRDLLKLIEELKQGTKKEMGQVLDEIKIYQQEIVSLKEAD